MNLDNIGNPSFDSVEILEELYKNPSLDLEQIQFENSTEVQNYNNAITELFLEDTARINIRDPKFYDLLRTDQANQSRWFMPEQYVHYDIERWLWLQCNTEEERLRIVEELEQYQARDLYPLLRYMKYLVDTMRKHKIVWGVGRGSSVASYVLFKIGIHKIDSLRYNLDWREFLR